MPRAKRASDETYNARRRAKRLLARLEREQANLSHSEALASQAYMDTLRKQISATYTPKRGSKAVRAALAAEAAQQARKLDTMTQGVRAKRTAGARANQLFVQQINRARLEKPSTFGKYGAHEVNVFYAATRRIWQGKDARKRNELIMKALGTTSMKEAFAYVLRQNRKALRESIRGESARRSFLEGITSENSAFYKEVGLDSERQGSPIWEPFINLIG